MAALMSERAIVVAVLLGPLLPGFATLFGQRMVFIPPREVRPVNGRPIALRRSAFQPQSTLGIFPDAHGVAVELLPAMQAPPFVL